MATYSGPQHKALTNCGKLRERETDAIAEAAKKTKRGVLFALTAGVSARDIAKEMKLSVPRIYQLKTEAERDMAVDDAASSV